MNEDDVQSAEAFEADGPTMPAMTDEDLAALVDHELSNAIGVDDELAQAGERNLDYYHGEPVGNLAPPEVEGRSKVVSRDVLDTIEWIMPALMRLFAGSDEVVRFEPDAPEEQQGADDATAYIGYLIHRKNNGFLLLHDAIKSALIARRGVVKCYCDKSWEQREERYTGLSVIEREALLADPEVELISEEIIEADLNGMPGVPQGAQLPPELLTTYNVHVHRRQQLVTLRAEGCPPEEIRISRKARSIESAPFVAHVVERTVSELKSLGYDPALVDSAADDASLEGAGEREARHGYDGSWHWNDSPDPSQRKITLAESFVTVDFNGDGIAEYRRIVKAGNVVFENDVVDDNEFALFCPILMPYKAIGLSVADLVTDLQEIKTALTRQVLDNVYLSNNPMREVVEGQVNLDDLLSPRPGGIVRVKAPGMTRDLVTPFVASNGMTLIDYFDKVREARTGITDFNQGLNPESLSKTNVGSMGVEALINAGMQRVELIARVFAETGIKRLYLLMLKLACQHVNRVQQVKINGRWMMIDPRAWRNQYDMTVSIGIGTASRQQQIANLREILGLQKEAAAVGLATPTNAYKALTRLAEAMGYRDSDQFFTAPKSDAAAPGAQGAPQPDDSQAAAQALIQAEQIKAQSSQQRAQMDNASKLQIAQMKIESDERIAQMKAETDLIKQHMAKLGDGIDAIKRALGLVQVGGVQ
jgi:hypothetical protein